MAKALGITIWIANQMVELQTQLAINTNLLGDSGSGQVGSLDQGGAPITYILANGLSAEFSIGLVVITALYIFCFGYTYLKYRRGTIYRTDQKTETTTTTTT